MFKSNVCHKEHFRKWVSSYLEVKNECSEHFRMFFFDFYIFLNDEVKIIFWKSKAKSWKLFKSNFFMGKINVLSAVKLQFKTALIMKMFIESIY